MAVWTVVPKEMYVEIVQAAPVTVVASILEEMYLESVQAVPMAVVESILEERCVEYVHAQPVTVMDSMVSVTIHGVCTGSTRGFCGQYCQKKCIWSLYRQYR